MPISIYALVDPDTLEVRYVGKAINISLRYRSHLIENGSTRKCRWISKLLSEGKRPIVIELEKIAGVASWESAEQHWIRFYKSIGQDLCNHTIGGDGLRGVDLETRKKISQHRLEYNLNNRETILKIMRSPERREKISAALKGKPKSPDHIKKLPQNQKGFDKSHLTPEQRKSQGHPNNQFAKGSKRTLLQIEAQRIRQIGVKRTKTWPQSAESNLKRSLTLKGRPKSSEWKEKIRQGQLKRWQKPNESRMQSDRIKAWHESRSENQNRKGDENEVFKIDITTNPTERASF